MNGFNLREGCLLSRRYEVVGKLGVGWEGEVYLIQELATGIERAAKLFFPQRNPNNRTAKQYALKLHKLRHCSILIQYLTQEVVSLNGQPVTVLISEYVEGEVLSEMLKRCRGYRLQPFEALHLLHALASGIADIHTAREYHGDLHTDNIIVRRFGIAFDIKLIDLFVCLFIRCQNAELLTKTSAISFGFSTIVSAAQHITPSIHRKLKPSVVASNAP